MGRKSIGQRNIKFINVIIDGEMIKIKLDKSERVEDHYELKRLAKNSMKQEEEEKNDDQENGKKKRKRRTNKKKMENENLNQNENIEENLSEIQIDSINDFSNLNSFLDMPSYQMDAPYEFELYDTFADSYFDTDENPFSDFLNY